MTRSIDSTTKSLRPKKTARTTKPFSMIHIGWWEVPVGTVAVGLEEYEDRPGMWHGWCDAPGMFGDHYTRPTLFVAHEDCLEFLDPHPPEAQQPEPEEEP